MRGLGGLGSGATTRITAAELLAPWRAKQQQEEEEAGAGTATGFDDYESGVGGEFVGQIYPHTRHLVLWSPDGRWLASAKGNRVTVRDPGSMQVHDMR